MKLKKLLIITLLTFTFLFASLYLQQKRAEAIAPWVAYVAVNVVASLTIGMIMYLFDSNGVGTQNTVTVIDPVTGAISLDRAEILDGDTAIIYEATSGLKWYPVTQHPQSNGIVPPGPAVIRSGLVGEAQWADVIANSASWYDTDFVTYIPNQEFSFGSWKHGYSAFTTDLIDDNLNDTYAGENLVSAGYIDIVGGVGGKNVISLSGGDIEIYDFLEDVPNLPNCFDGIQNQDETGIDCGGVCEINFGFVCLPPLETCFDGIMNQDETGIDYGGVCGTGTPVSQPPANFTDTNQDGIDDISGVDSTGSIPVGTVSGSVGTADSSTYDASLPGDVSEVGETDWPGLITGYLASNPLVILATGSQINVAGSTCSLPLTLFGKSMSIDFCSLEWMVELFGTFVLGLMTIRAVFIAMGI